MANAVPGALLHALVVLLSCAPGPWPIVTEVFYDAIGDDTGWEYVELWNRSDHDVPLAGVTIEGGDGAGPGRWTKRWTGAKRDTIRAHARFVVGGAKLVPPADAIVTLELQNGPDGMRVTWPDGTREVVGWGALAVPEYYCGAPAEDAPAGQSLARVPDDADLGSNALDFRVAEPSPGRVNLPDVNLAVARATLVLSPANPEPGETVRVTFDVVNRGAAPVGAGAARVLLAGDALLDTVRAGLAALAVRETLHVSLAGVAGPAGRRQLGASVSVPGDAVPQDDADTLAVRVGPGPLEVTEIQFHPAAGEGEWVEVRNRSGEALALDDFTISDDGTGRARIAGPAPIEADSLGVFAENRAALLAAFPALDPSRVVQAAPWQALNNGDGADGIADQVVLRESDGLVSDRVAYSAKGVPAGTPLEKLSGGWSPSSAPNGTPLAPPRPPAEASARFEVTPRRVTLASPELELSWRLLDGETSAASATRRARLDGAGPGVYVLVLSARGPHGTVTRSQALRVAGARP